jgi:hypothetical protein
MFCGSVLKKEIINFNFATSLRRDLLSLLCLRFLTRLQIVIRILQQVLVIYIIHNKCYSLLTEASVPISPGLQFSIFEIVFDNNSSRSA